MLDINKIKKENLINTSKTTNELLEYLKKNYPQTISDNTPNLNVIADLLGLNTKTQGYELTFTGKSFANALYNTPNTKELKFEKEQSKDEKSTKNIIIKGNNLDALKLLKQSYYEKIKMIYIDPPYNTKNDEFIYQDDFRKDYKKLLLQTELLEIDEDGNEIESETLKFFRNIKSSKTHSAWLAFMLPRLKLARDLLREDGVIFISIDDNEQANLKILCDEIFGEENFISNIVWECRNPNVDIVSTDHEYCIVYAKHKNYIRPIYKKIQGSYINLGDYNWCGRVIEREYPKIDENGEFRYVSVGTVTPRQAHYTYYIDVNTLKGYNCSYGDIDNLDRTKYVGHRYYAMPLENCLRNIKENKFIIVSDKENIYSLKEKRYKNEEMPYASLVSVIKRDLFKYDDSNADLKHLNIVFDYAKPVNFIKHFLIASTSNNDIILDFFAGSGTTAQAVMELNAEDNRNRKFILVQLDEKIDEKKSKVAYDFCKNELNSQNPVISDITIERIKRASEKIAKENADKNLDLGFKVFSMVEKPELISDDVGTLSLENHANLSPYEKALNLALQDCKTLDNDIKMILKDKIYQCEQSFYVVKFDDEVLNFLKNTQNENVYINGFDDINLEIYLNLESFLKERLKVVY
ncbi:TPA: site-specific DNA-methyltransferase [Campylobacter jejuni]|nr:site-specific DNA-methyltransferase [Campylobacter jejuni]